MLTRNWQVRKIFWLRNRKYFIKNHHFIPALTEQERLALKQSNDFFNFGSDGEELGGELEEGLEGGIEPAENGGGAGDGGGHHSSMVHRMGQLSMQGGGGPSAPLTVQTAAPAPSYHHITNPSRCSTTTSSLR